MATPKPAAKTQDKTAAPAPAAAAPAATAATTPAAPAAAETATAATAAAAVQPTAVIETLKGYGENMTENLKGYGENLTQAGSVANDTLRSTFNGVVAFDRALFNMFRANLDNWVDHGRNIVKAPSIAAVAEQHRDFLVNQIEVVSGQIKDLSDVAEEQSKASMAPLFAAVDTMVSVAKTKADKAA